MKIRHSNKYTLVELLVVIGVLAILVALAFPAALRVSKEKKVALAREEVLQIKQAIQAYVAEYKYLPGYKEITPGKNENMNGDLVSLSAPTSQKIINILTGNDTTLNPKKIKFLKKRDFFRNSGMNDKANDYKRQIEEEDAKNDNWIDPWGNPYIIGLDYNYDKEIKVNKYIPTSSGKIFYTQFLVYSKGPDGMTGVDWLFIKNKNLVNRAIKNNIDDNSDGKIDKKELSPTIKDDINSW
jgi:type II secretory pathway pseudopilin PulG